jgi:ADP-heptose:LPS heptosyltransferase
VALGVKTITLFGPENPFEWHPYAKDEHPIAYVENLPCRKSLAPGLPEWCAIRECVSEKHRCMREIAVEDVTRLW